MILEELLIPLGVEFTGAEAGKIRRFSDSVGALASQVVKLSLALTAASTAASAFVLVVAKKTEDVARSAGVMGQAVDEMDRWNRVANLATGRTDGIASGMQALARNASEASRGIGRSIQAFGLLTQFGFQGVYDDRGQLRGTSELLLDVAEALSKVEDPSRRIELAERLGLGSFIPLIQKGRAGIEELISDLDGLGFITEEDAAISAELMKSWRMLTVVLADASRFISTSIAPALNGIVRTSVEWYRANRDVLRQRFLPFLKAAGGLLAAFWRTLVQLVRLMTFITDRTVGFRNALYGAVIVLGALMALLSGATIVAAVLLVQKLAAYFMVIGAAALATKATMAILIATVIVLLAALFLILEDIFTTLEGGEGVLDKFVRKFPLIEGPLRLISSYLLVAGTALESIYEILNAPLSKDSWVNSLSRMRAAGKTFVDEQVQGGLQVMGGLGIHRQLGGMLGLPEWLSDFVVKAAGETTQMNPAAIGGVALGGVSGRNRTSSSVTVNSPITINGSTDSADVVAQKVQQAIEDMVDLFKDDTSTPVDR